MFTTFNSCGTFGKCVIGFLVFPNAWYIQIKQGYEAGLEWLILESFSWPSRLLAQKETEFL